MNGVNFTRGKGGLGRELPGEDHISGLIVYGEDGFEKKELSSSDDLKHIVITENPVLHYHVSEFFRINEGAKLYAQAVPTSDGNFTEVSVLQNFAQGKIRQFAVCDVLTSIKNLQENTTKLNQIAKNLADRITPLSMLYSCKAESSDMTSLPNLHTMNSEHVSVVIGQDGNGRGAFVGNSVSCIGAVLGCMSKASVHESISWVEKQNLLSTAYSKDFTDGEVKALELDTPAFCDGSLVGDYTPGQIGALDEKGYIFLRNYPGNVGTYVNDSYTATALNNDYAYIENNRTIDKAIREVNRVLLPKVSGPAYIDDTGKLESSTVKALEALCDEPLDEMKRKGEVSGFKVSINPNQRILQTSKLEVVIKIVPVGVLREIEVKIGFVINLK